MPPVNIGYHARVGNRFESFDSLVIQVRGEAEQNLSSDPHASTAVTQRLLLIPSEIAFTSGVCVFQGPRYMKNSQNNCGLAKEGCATEPEQVVYYVGNGIENSARQGRERFIIQTDHFLTAFTGLQGTVTLESGFPIILIPSDVPAQRSVKGEDLEQSH